MEWLSINQILYPILKQILWAINSRIFSFLKRCKVIIKCVRKLSGFYFYIPLEKHPRDFHVHVWRSQKLCLVIIVIWDNHRIFYFIFFVLPNWFSFPFWFLSFIRYAMFTICFLKGNASFSVPPCDHPNYNLSYMLSFVGHVVKSFTCGVWATWICSFSCVSYKIINKEAFDSFWLFLKFFHS